MDETCETKEEGGVSLKDIWCVVKKRIWILLGISVLIAAVAAFGFGFIINPRLAYYNMEFQIVYPSDTLDKYPDGTPFYTYTIISKDSLQAVKDGDPAFAKIDVEKMVDRKDITLSADRGSYVIVVKGSYFANAKAGEAFVRAVVEQAVDKFTNSANHINYQLNEEVFKNASFEERMQLLTELKNGMYSTYDAWINRFSTTYTVDGATLRSYRLSLNLVYSDSVQNALKNDLIAYGFDNLYLDDATINDDALLKTAIDKKIKLLEAERKLNLEKIEALSRKDEQSPNTPDPATYAVTPYAEGDGSPTIVIDSGGNATVSEKLASYLERNEQINYQINTMLNCTNPQLPFGWDNIREYSKRIDEQYDELCKAADVLTSVVGGIYRENMKVHYETPRIVRSGTIGLILVAVGVFVLAFVVGAVIVYYQDRKKLFACADKLPAEEKGETEKNAQTEERADEAEKPVQTE